ncbi:TetR/AcrR family transcriptional regulator [Sphingosinicella sp.]|uniref:TetR/AcrR family transcriptional regulator n=1 Tax=Sphingosinicella sp. TaxID=1917971 RepID=UPI004037C482
MPRLHRNRQALIERAAALFATRPAEQLGLQAIAEACDVSMWALRYNFGDAETLFHAVAAQLMDRVEALSSGRPSDEAQTTIDALASHAAFLADLFASDAYRDMLLPMLRGRDRAWLCDAYERRILALLCRQVEAVVQESGRLRGVTILMRDGAARRLVKRLETAFALAPLLPAGEPPAADERERLLGEAVREAFAATYLFEWSVPAAA